MPNNNSIEHMGSKDFNKLNNPKASVETLLANKIVPKNEQSIETAIIKNVLLIYLYIYIYLLIDILYNCFE